MRPEWLAVFAKTTGNACATLGAGASLGQVVVADVVPVAHNDGVVAAGAIGGAAFRVVHVAGIDVVQSGIQRDAAGVRALQGQV